MNLLRRHPSFVALVVLLCATAIRPLPPLVDAATGSVPGEVDLVRPTLYVVLAPLSNVLDAFTFFSLGRAQWALAVWALALAAWGATRPGSLRRRTGRALVGPLGLIVVAGAAVVLPRPVPRLVTADTAATILDYHAHTEASHDGRAGWTLARLARWHARQGFEASYVTDHNQVFGGTVTDSIRLLPGAEWSVHRLHVVALGAVTPIARDSFTGTTERMLPVFREIERQGGIGIASLPEYWRNYRGELEALVAAGADGFELVNCSPKGLAFPPEGRREVLALAARHDLVVVGVSDHHGWGQATCVWNLALPGVQGHRANRVFARPLALLQGEWRPWTAPVTQLWFMLRGLTWSERVSWLTWLLVVWFYRALPRRKGQGAGFGILARSVMES